jgi:hypothetical protein
MRSRAVWRSSQWAKIFGQVAASAILIRPFSMYVPVAARRNGAENMEGTETSLRRLAAHLPNMTLNDPIARITVDKRGRVWVAEDTTLVILRGHLVIEAELIDICGRCLQSPDALGRVPFSVRLNLVRALIGTDAMPDQFWQAISDVNRMRNKLAHKLEPEGIDGELSQFFCRFDGVEDFRTLLRDDESVPQRLISCFVFLTAALSGVARPSADSTGEVPK